MCGIIAFLTQEGCSDNKTPDLQAALQQIQHRGPDGDGIWVDSHGQVGFGHVRLAIIDLEQGHQPISNETDDIHMIVNGEFYDFERIRGELEAAGHVFKTKSDSEIALHLYEDQGLSFLDTLRGEFALCLWDSRKSLFVCARDRFGIKPLFYTQINGRLFVASEIKAFLPLGLKAEWDVESIMNSGFTAGSQTVFKGVSNLLPGHYITATRSGVINIRKYWEPDFADKNIVETRSAEEMIDGVRSRFFEAVRLRLRADVPVAAYLSGGIDSSSVVAAATTILRQNNPNAKLTAFTISFPHGKHLDESDIAERMAKHCGADFKKLCVSEADLSNAFDDAIWHFEAPVQELCGIAKYLLSRLVRDSGFKVVLTGEGSDEHFAGYSFFMPDYLREPDTSFNCDIDQRLAKLEAIEESCHLWDSITLRDMSYTDAIVSRRMLNGISTHRVLTSTWCLPNEIFNEAILKRAGLTEPDPCMAMATTIDGVARRKAKTKWHPLHTALCVEQASMLPNYICIHEGDRSEMAHSVEARVPFLDHHLTEYVNQLPPSVKIKYPTEKWILREAMKPYINEELYLRIKHPFIAPPAEDKNTPHGIYLNKRLTREAIDAIGWIRWEFVEQMKVNFFEHQSRRAQNVLNMVLSLVVISERFKVKRFGQE
ncbi:unnamed protein product [Adineta steineri]|uniref:Asparagine synthetase [glutamine-hydrolyzing] n=2 Tax=Adineta steineri TaxID=433720 RepID=A0A815E7N2_9BILA|nr:unnamed protein product [Adineta steineri]